MTRKKRVFLGIAGAVFVAGACVFQYLARFVHYQKAVDGITVSGDAIGGVADGTYQGECDVDFIRVKVSVTVENGAVAGITLLEHRNGRGAPAEKILEDIVARQRVDVETVAGATNSSKVIQKAVENALMQ